MAKPKQGEVMAPGEPVPFDYTGIVPDDVAALERHAVTIDSVGPVVRKTESDGILVIGRELKAAQDRLANHHDGTFNKWVEQRCGFSKRTAYNAISAYTTFGCATVAQLFDARALYLLSAESTPEAATEEALRLANEGEVITHKRAKAIVDQYPTNTKGNSVDDPPQWKTKSYKRAVIAGLEALCDEIHSLLDQPASVNISIYDVKLKFKELREAVSRMLV